VELLLVVGGYGGGGIMVVDIMGMGK